uniref:Uncharacterized protein n=1 Tax=Micrurus spixii TaxID=129469 RepID=A0A2D4L6H4_9SAUR
MSVPKSRLKIFSHSDDCRVWCQEHHSSVSLVCMCMCKEKESLWVLLHYCSHLFWEGGAPFRFFKPLSQKYPKAFLQLYGQYDIMFQRKTLGETQNAVTFP